MKKLKLGVSGEKGSFSEEAGLLYAKRIGREYELDYLIDMENVLATLENKKIDLGIFPVVNLNGGLVKMAFEAMGKHLFKPIDELWLDVEQCLLVQPGMQTHQIRKIASHSQALLQCEKYLKKYFPQAELIEWQDTAKAARDLSEGRLQDSAVIAPIKSAELYQLKVMEKNIQDNKPNLTAFIIVEAF